MVYFSKDKVKLIIVIILSLIFMAGSANAATYFVDFENGIDSNNGTTSGTPFKHHPWDGEATSTAGSTSLSAGDKVLFNRGTIYEATTSDTGTLFENEDTSGNTASPIIMGAYGIGDKPIIVAGKPLDESQFTLYSGSVAGENAVWRASLSDIGLTGVSTTYMHFFEADRWNSFTQPLAEFYANNGTVPDANREFYYNSGSGFLYLRMSDGGDISGKDIYASWMKEFFVTSSYGYRFENLKFYGGMWYTFNISGSPSSGYTVQFENVDMGWARNGIYSPNGAVHISNSNFHYFMDVRDSNGSALVAGGISGTTPSLIEDSGFRRYENAVMFFGTGNAHIVRRNFFMDAANGDGSYDNAEHAIRVNDTGHSIMIYRNIFFNPGNDCWFDNGEAADSVYFWNNTVYENRARMLTNEKSVIDTGYSDDFTLDNRNNVIAGRINVADANSTECGGDGCNPDYSTIKLAHNYYVIYPNYIARTHNPNGGSSVQITLLSDWQAWLENAALAPVGGREENSGQETSWSNLTNIFESITYGDSNFLAPNPNGPLINKGELILTGENGIDKKGINVAGEFDIGAYEHNVPPNAPTLSLPD